MPVLICKSLTRSPVGRIVPECGNELAVLKDVLLALNFASVREEKRDDGKEGED